MNNIRLSMFLFIYFYLLSAIFSFTKICRYFIFVIYEIRHGPRNHIFLNFLRQNALGCTSYPFFVVLYINGNQIYQAAPKISKASRACNMYNIRVDRRTYTKLHITIWAPFSKQTLKLLLIYFFIQYTYWVCDNNFLLNLISRISKRNTWLIAHCFNSMESRLNALKPIPFQWHFYRHKNLFH